MVCVIKVHDLALRTTPAYIELASPRIANIDNVTVTTSGHGVAVTLRVRLITLHSRRVAPKPVEEIPKERCIGIANRVSSATNFPHHVFSIQLRSKRS